MSEFDNFKGIELTEFLRNYLNIYNDEFKHATHHDLKEFAVPKVQAVPFEIVTDEDLNRGNIILVKDRLGHIAPYIRPNMCKKFERENMMMDPNTSLEELYELMYEAIYEEEVEAMIREVYGEDEEDVEKVHKKC